MAEFLNLFGFLSVLLRAFTLAGQSLAGGGVAFLLVCLRSGEPQQWASCRRLIRLAAWGLAITQILFVGTDSYLLMGTVGLSLGDMVSADFFLAGCLAILSAVAVALTAGRLTARSWWALAPVLGTLAASVMTSHAAARMSLRVPALVLTALHQGATMLWIGGLPFLLIALNKAHESAPIQKAARRFSKLAQVSVALILLSGIGLGIGYVGSVSALYGTSYGVMVMGKAFMFAALVAIGAINLLILRSLKGKPEPLLSRLKRLSEAEIGIGFTIVLAAASLTSQAPAVDVIAGRATARDIVERFTPRAPRLESPRFGDLLVTPDPATVAAGGVRMTPRRASNIAWSEYNHNSAGVVVLAMGLLAVASRVFRLRWARHWPLAFLGLALFLFFRADADAWPLGPRGFWTSLVDPEILQHRLFALMIVAFAVFEWGVQVGRIHSRAAALVFPSICAVGGALLLTHSHSLGNVKEEYLAEISHLPIAILAVGAGSARWLEQRLDGAWRRLPSMIWPVCFVVIGLLLLFYREV